ncbi:MAG: TetR/AcrR family transcriptional regulator [Kyrpidia tusciae]|nr:TetR/AcrR family transcriptional regulator [Kyrpidia tusciae]MBE3553400.1 TetR/AcrR family transcriptional regulator [Kyrpidia tusciae]
MSRVSPDTKQAIIDAAAKLFEEHGYERVSMRNIAREVGCSATTIYIYFENKDALLAELIKQAYALFKHRIREGLRARDTDDRSNFRRACRAYIQFGLEYPKYYNLMFRDNAEKFIRVSAGDRDDDRYDAFEFLRRAVQEGIDRGIVKGTNADLVSQSIWASLHGLTSLLLAFPGFEWQSREALIDFHIDALQGGVLR